MGKMVGAGAGTKIFDKLEPEPHKKSIGCAKLQFELIIIKRFVLVYASYMISFAKSENILTFNYLCSFPTCTRLVVSVLSPKFSNEKLFSLSTSKAKRSALFTKRSALLAYI
jgi:hypothetical protein